MTERRKENIETFTWLKAYHQYMNRLIPLYGEREARKIFLLLAEDLWKVPVTRIFTDPGQLGKLRRKQLDKILDRLTSHEPVQYITGKTEFLNCKLIIRKRVLIPRSETEEMAAMVIRENKMNAPAIFDICTGSGCLAVAMKKNIPGAFVMAADISGYALYISELNATANDTRIIFVKMDILKKSAWNKIKTKFDIIVSNPPYVTHEEYVHLPLNVRNFEPPSALRVPDESPLLFYENIALRSQEILNSQGKIYVEINERFGNETAELFKRQGYQQVEILRDVYGKDRYIKAVME